MMMRKRNSNFGSDGAYVCQACGRMTRQTGVQSMGSELCPEDYELAGYYNELQDNTLDIGRSGASIKSLCAAIVDKGGELDGDALDLLSAAGYAS